MVCGGISNRTFTVYRQWVFEIDAPPHWNQDLLAETEIQFLAHDLIVFANPYYEPEMFNITKDEWERIRIGLDGKVYRVDADG